MKKVKLVILLLVIAAFLSTTIVFFINKKSKKISFSLKDINLSLTENAASLSSISSTDEYRLSGDVNYAPDYKKEEEAISLAKEVTSAIDRIENEKFEDTEKYFKRLPRPKFEEMSDMYVLSEEFDQFTKDETSLWVIWLLWRNQRMHIQDIKGIQVTYSSNNKYIVKVMLNDILLKLDPNSDEYTHFLDAILEYEISRDQFSSELKVSHLSYQFMTDIDQYRENINQAEKDNNKNNRNSASLNIFAPENAKGYDYSKVKNIDQVKAQEVFNKNVSKTVILGVNNEYGLVTNGYGFFIRKGVVVTSWKVAENFFKDKTLNSSVITSDNKTHEIEGIITASPDMDIAIIKLKEEIGEKVNLGDAKQLSTQDPILVIGSPLGLVPILRAGLYAGFVEEGYQSIKISLPLTKEDSGSPIFNLSGDVIGINTSAGNESPEFNGDSSYGQSSLTLKSAYETLSKQNFSDIKVITKEDIYNANDAESDSASKMAKDNKFYKQFTTISDPEQVKALKLESIFETAGLLSLRYKNISKDFIENPLLIDAYARTLNDKGFKLAFSSGKTKTYVKDNEVIRIYSRFNYLSIVYGRNK